MTILNAVAIHPTHKIDWNREFLAGAVLSAVFTIMAACADRTETVGDVLGEQVRLSIVFCGGAMTLLFSFCFLVLFMGRGLDLLKRIVLDPQLELNFPPMPRLRTAKLIKIFLP